MIIWQVGLRAEARTASTDREAGGLEGRIRRQIPGHSQRIVAFDGSKAEGGHARRLLRGLVECREPLR